MFAASHHKNNTTITGALIFQNAFHFSITPQSLKGSPSAKSLNMCACLALEWINVPVFNLPISHLYCVWFFRYFLARQVSDEM
jgi:hypothetical protein